MNENKKIDKRRQAKGKKNESKEKKEKGKTNCAKNEVK